MDLTPQDDTGTVEGANAYITEAYYTEYHAAYGNAQPATAVLTIPQAIMVATRAIDLWWERRFPGRRLVAGQSTAWPRYGVPRDDLVTVIVGLPIELGPTTAELALRARAGPLLVDLAATASPDAVIKRFKEKVGPLEEETEYATGADAEQVRQAPSFPIVEQLIAPLLGPLPQGGTYR